MVAVGGERRREEAVVYFRQRLTYTCTCSGFFVELEGEDHEHECIHIKVFREELEARRKRIELHDDETDLPFR
jgi:hypothetical protein